MLRKFAFSWFLLLAAVGSLLGSGPENVVVVVNAQSASSKLVANYYIRERKIPPINVVYLSGIQRGELIELKDFKETILRPLLQELDKRKISSQIDCVIYSSGFPTKIDARSTRLVMRNSDNRQWQNLANSDTSLPELSITSATFYYHSVLTNQYDIYQSLVSNFYYRGKTGNTLTRPFVDQDQAEFMKATRLARSRKLDEAIRLMQKLADKHPLQVATHYWLARMHAQNDDAEAAIYAMKRAIDTGWSYRDYTRSDAAFKNLTDNPSFQDTLKTIPDFSFHELTSQSFQGQNVWSYNGSVNSTSDQGRRYLLSTMLSVTRNKGISEKQTLDYLRTSIGADGTLPRGTFYFTRTNDIRTKTRLPNFKSTMTELKQLGYPSEIFVGRLPKNRRDVLGLMIGTPKFDWRSSGSRILPGAICDNLTSFGGWLKPSVGQTKLSEFLKNGAAGSSGTVREPFALQMKFPHPRLHVHYVRGCTLAESFYQSIRGPFQLLIVGDALCRPFAKAPKIEITGPFTSGDALSGNVEVLADASKSPVEIKHTEIFVNGRRMAVVDNFGEKPFNVDTTTLPDGYHEFRFVPVSTGSVAVKGHTIVPIIVNNRGRTVDLKFSGKKIPINGAANLQFDAPEADEVKLLHNSRTLASSKKSKGQFNIRAFELGRGTVTVQAVAKYGEEVVGSVPVEITVAGAASTKIPTVKSIPRPNIKK